MGRYYLAIGIFMTLSAFPAFGQYVDALQACSQDVDQLCPAARLAKGQFSECIKSKFEVLSEPCKAALVQIATVGKSCRTDIQTQCPSIEPGAGRILLCVKEHYVALSPQCKDAIGRAAERRRRSH